ncbi:MAG: hypothetical protein ACTHKG_01690 [Nocardioides sp.]
MTGTPLDGPDLAEALALAGLDADTLVSHEALASGEQAWALRSTSETWFAEWRTLRDLVATTGRWPVAMTSWGYEIDPLNRRGTDPRSGLDEGPAAIMGRVAAVDIDGALDRLEAGSDPMPLDEWFEYHEEATRRRCGAAPTIEQVRAALGEEPLEMDIERWLLRW